MLDAGIQEKKKQKKFGSNFLCGVKSHEEKRRRGNMG